MTSLARNRASGGAQSLSPVGASNSGQPQTTDDKQQRRRHSAWISRKLRLLRAHALITKIVGTHRYQLTSSGRRIIVAILSALRSTVAQLTPVTAQLTAVAA